MASDTSSGFYSFPTRDITHFFTDTQSTTERVEEKNKRTNTDLGQLQAQERGKSMWHCAALRAFVDYRDRVFCAKLLQSH